MRALFLVWCGLMPLLYAGELTFAEKTREVAVTADAATATAEFPFTNRSNQKVKIKRYEASCSCLEASLEGGKAEYAPGESGLIRTRIDIGAATGVVDKQLAVWLDGDADDAPSIQLTTRVKVPEVIHIEPRNLKWEIGATADSKSITLTVDWPEPVHLLNVSSPNTTFRYELKKVEDGRKYELVVTPVDTKKSSLAMIRIETDCKVAKHREKIVSAIIRPAVPTAAGK